MRACRQHSQSKLRTIRIRDTDEGVVPSNTMSFFIAHRRPLVVEAAQRVSRAAGGIDRSAHSRLERV